MDACELEKASEKQSTAESTRQPLVSADNKNGTTGRSQTREVGSRYRSPTPYAISGPKRFPSPNVTRKSSTSTVSVPPRATSAERKRPSTPSSPRSRSPSTPVQDTAADTMLASRKTTSNKMPESLWPSTMRNLGCSFQSDSSSLAAAKTEKSVLHMPSERTLRPSSNVARQVESFPSQKPMPERSRSPAKGKNSADQLENSKPVDGLSARQLDHHRWPSRTSGKTFTAVSKSDVIDKMDKTSFSTNSGLIKPSSRGLSLDVAMKSDITDKMGETARPSSRRLSLGGIIKSDATDQMDKMSVSSDSGIVKPSSRRLSLDGAMKSDITNKIDKPSDLCNSGTFKPSSGRLSLDGSIKSDATTDQMSKMSVSSDFGMVKPSPRRLSLDGAMKSDIPNKVDKTSDLCRSRAIKPSSPSLRRVSLDGTIKSDATDQMDKMSVSSDSGTVKPSPRRLSLHVPMKSDISKKVDKTSDLRGYGTIRPSSPSLRRQDGTIKSDATDQRDGMSASSDSGTVKPSPRRLSLHVPLKSDISNKVDKTSDLCRSGTIKPSSPSLRRLSLGGRIKTDATDQMDKMSVSLDSGTDKPYLKRLSLDGAMKSDTANTVDNTSDLCQDGTMKSDASEQEDQMSVLSDSGTDKSSPRILSLEGAIKTDITNKLDRTSNLSTDEPSSRRFSLDGTIEVDADHMDKTVLSDIGTLKSSRRRLSVDGGIKCDAIDKMDKTSISSNSGSGKSHLSRLSLDGASKPIKKSATDLLMQMSRDGNVKEMLFGRSFDEGLPRIQRPSSSSSSSDRVQLINAAARTQSLQIPVPPRLPLISVSRGESQSSAKATVPSSRGASPGRVRPSSPSRQSQNSTSVLSFIADAKKGNMTANSEDVHQLRLLYNRHLQWRFANARAGAALQSQRVKSEKMLYGMLRIIADIWILTRKKRSNFQQLGLKLKLFSALHSQVTCLDEWTSIEKDHTNSLARFIQALQTSTILMPLTRGARGDINSVKAAIYSASHVMQSVGSSLSSTLSKVEEMNSLIAELADVAARETTVLNKCDSLLVSTDAYQVEQCYLQTLVLQMKRGC